MRGCARERGCDAHESTMIALRTRQMASRMSALGGLAEAAASCCLPLSSSLSLSLSLGAVAGSREGVSQMNLPPVCVGRGGGAGRRRGQRRRGRPEAVA